MPTLCPKLYELPANVLIRGVVMLDIGWVVPNWITWLIQTWKFDVLRNYQHSYMLFLCILHIKSTVSCFILEVTNYEPLVYHILLVYDNYV